MSLLKLCHYKRSSNSIKHLTHYFRPVEKAASRFIANIEKDSTWIFKYLDGKRSSRSDRIIKRLLYDREGAMVHEIYDQEKFENKKIEDKRDI